MRKMILIAVVVVLGVMGFAYALGLYATTVFAKYV